MKWAVVNVREAIAWDIVLPWRRGVERLRPRKPTKTWLPHCVGRMDYARETCISWTHVKSRVKQHFYKHQMTSSASRMSCFKL